MIGSEHLVAAAEAAATMLATGLRDSTGAPWTSGSLEEWALAAATLQRVSDIVSAAQDLSIARRAAIEVEEAEDGTLREVHRAPGHVSLDAAPVVSGALTTTTARAERRVRAAVARAADGAAGSGDRTGLAGLHAATADGRLDEYRADVVTEELEEAPPEVRVTVVAAVDPHLATDTGPELRRRCRRLLARISPDLLRQRARRARSESRLERWAAEPGVDCWHGTFPSEEAARAWAAIDALAQRYVADGTCDRVDRARAKALTDLVTGNATVETRVVLTVPAAAAVPDAEGSPPTDADPIDSDPVEPAVAAAPVHPDDLVEVLGPRPVEPVLVPRGWLSGLTRDTARAARRAAATPTHRPCDPATGALLPDGPERYAGAGPYRPGQQLAALVRSRDGRCRFPGCHVAARSCDLDHVRPWPAGPTSAENLVCLCRRHHRTKQRAGWRVSMTPDAGLTWSDPTGRVRTTRPRDALDAVVLRRRPDEPHWVAHRPRLRLPDGPHSALEHHLEHLVAAGPRRRPPPPPGRVAGLSNPEPQEPPF